MGIRRTVQYIAGAATTLALLPQAALAAVATTEAPVAEATEAAAEAAGGYVPMAPTDGKGMPVDGGVWFQDQYSPIGDYGAWMHDALLMPLITVISLFVLLLLLWVMVRYRRGKNPNPSKTSHNTLIEVIWTGVPVLILLGIAVPSIDLLAKQYESPPEDALTVKVNGYQWYWGYEYPDNGGFEVISNMLPEEEAIARGEPAQLAVDNRMVVPAGVPIRIQTIGMDVIHSFAVPSLWFKLDAVPGRLNEKALFIKEPGVYYGQCSELCGVRHGYMPITVEALPKEQFEAWVLEQGGELAGADEAAEAPAAAEEGDAEVTTEGEEPAAADVTTA
ncbi:cytochrome c oxidase subunit II [Croceicoccus gelatinilyticus]|uniref:cytochrome c oxidase subunit II n=1 Tax=Croceicoccus gelatinilyticus TaxID=2835536 RepID=UPI001BCC22A3|nr:cytochrome c oxidase subunit II [Croceicoccus gelatinilyticus]MBS7670594.1 cytochrome c oxidase subunit II [Croceicoccus gelatinilyticus]